MNKIFLKPGREKSVINQHPWLFSGAIAKIEGEPESGEIVEVYSHKNIFLGQGFYNKNTSIAVRFLTFIKEPINADFWRKKITQAFELRKQIIDFSKTDAYRLIHGEGDFLPGLTLDKYADYLVWQCSTTGLEKIKAQLITIIQDCFQPKGIYERSDIPSRKVENLGLNNQIIYGEIPELIEIKENGLKFLVDLKKGQKTGFFLDQRENRKRVGELAPGKKVLNCFCYSGGFSIYAAQSGAAKTTNLDISGEALELAKKNYQLNNCDLEALEFISADVFEELRKYKKENKKYDLIILDPPAFAKNAAAVKTAARGYKDINLQALNILETNGLLVTCSCSQHLDKALFQKIVHDAALDAQRKLQILEIRGQAADHPIAATHPEGEYLKCLICRVI